MTTPHDRELPPQPPEQSRSDLERSRSAIALAITDTLQFQRNEFLIRAGNGTPGAYLITRGFAIGYKLLASGRRQVVDLYLPGDIVGFIGLFIRSADWNVVAMTGTDAELLARADLMEARQANPAVFHHLVGMAFRSTARLSEQVVRLGARTAPEGLAHMLLELQYRLRDLGLAEVDRLALPMTQDLIADILGVSTVHLNRTIRQMEDDGLILYDRNGIKLVDEAALVRLAEFDGAYLRAPEPLLA